MRKLVLSDNLIMNSLFILSFLFIVVTTSIVMVEMKDKIKQVKKISQNI